PAPSAGFFSYRPGRTSGTLHLVSSPPAKIYVVGIGSDGLAGVTARARELVTSAELLLGSEQTLDWLPEAKAERRRIGSDLQEAVRLVEANLGRRRVVIVAGGDPLFY